MPNGEVSVRSSGVQWDPKRQLPESYVHASHIAAPDIGQKQMYNARREMNIVGYTSERLKVRDVMQLKMNLP